tara:strand:- start:174 stop:773 length:600 start_codon:yes stop_codon:yes gene_type:complete
VSKRFLQSSLEKVLNQALSLDPYCTANLQKLDGKLIEIALDNSEHLLRIRIVSTHVRVESPTEKDQPHVRIQGSVAAYIKMISDIRQARPVFGSQMCISGDVETVQTLKTLLSELEIDWEEQIAQWFGDTAAHGIGLAVRSLHRWGRQTSDSFWCDLGEYLTEEKEFVPNGDEVKHYIDGVDEIRDDVERLAARVERLS